MNTRPTPDGTSFLTNVLRGDKYHQKYLQQPNDFVVLDIAFDAKGKLMPDCVAVYARNSVIQFAGCTMKGKRFAHFFTGLRTLLVLCVIGCVIFLVTKCNISSNEYERSRKADIIANPIEKRCINGLKFYRNRAYYENDNGPWVQFVNDKGQAEVCE